jgi:hypothetical protein
MKVKITVVCSEEREIDLQDKDDLEALDLEIGATQEDVIEKLEEEFEQVDENWLVDQAGLASIEILP